MVAPKGNTPASATMPPPLPPPPASPVSGIKPQLRQIAPELTDKPKGMDPAAEFAARQRASIEKHTGQRAQDEAAREAPATPPKATQNTSQSSNAGSAKNSDTPATPASAKESKVAGADQSSETPAGGKTAEEPAERERRYDYASLKKWAEQHPEEAAAVAEKLFWQGKMQPDTRAEWIRLKNRERKVREGITKAQEDAMAPVAAERAAAKADREAMEQAQQRLDPICILWEAVAEPIKADPKNPKIDFDAADAAFLENTGIALDDYLRLRARRIVGSTPNEARLRIQNAKLQKELEAAKPKPVETPAEAPAPARARKPAREVVDWSSELPAGHKLRQLEGWNELLDAEMANYHDQELDEYNADPEELADGILKRQIESMMAEEDAPPAPAPAPRARPKVPQKKRDGNGNTKTASQGRAVEQRIPGVPSAKELTPKTPAESADIDDDPFASKIDKLWSKRVNKALANHQRRLTGELADE